MTHNAHVSGTSTGFRGIKHPVSTAQPVVITAIYRLTHLDKRAIDMVKFQGLEAYVVNDDMSRIEELGPRAGERYGKKAQQSNFFGHNRQQVVYFESAGSRHPHFIVRCTDNFDFGQYPDLEVRCLTNKGRAYLGYIAKTSEDRSLFLKESDSVALDPTESQILVGVTNGVCFKRV